MSSDQRRRGRSRWLNLPALAVAVLVVGAWQWAVQWRLIELDYLPSPQAIAVTTGELLSSGDLGEAARHTVAASVLAAVLAILIGGAFGVLLATSRTLRTWTGASVDILRTVPVVALMPVALLVWGSSTRAEVIVATYAGLWVMIVNTAGGVAQVHPRLHDVGTVFQLSRTDRLRKVIAPAAAASMLVGARLTVVTSLVICIVAEMLISYQGLGYSLVRAQNALQPEQMWTFALTCGLLGYVANVLLLRAARLALPGMRELRAATS